MAKTQGLNGFRPKLISIAVASCFVTGTALANPTAPTVVYGSANFQQSGNLLKITNSPSAIINWQSFSIGAGEITRFIQQSQSSSVLNRVTGSAGAIDPSVILGALQSNGRVFLINPSGIVFGAGAQVDVAGLVASSLNLSNADFLANRLKFTESQGAGAVVNQGNINTRSGGNVYLVGPAVTNSGIITSPNGEVILAAGNSVSLVDAGTPNLQVEITAPDNQAVNLGRIIVDSGRAGIYAGLIKQAGMIRANSVVAGEGGQIKLVATKSATLEAGSVTTANGPSGGSVTVQSGDTTLVAGSVKAKGSQGTGGTVQLLGDKVGVYGNALVDASGDAGGGTVLVGGDFQGKNADIQNATATFFGSNATIKADAVRNGDGGKVIVWSDDATRAYGTISARGGADSGNGGFVEVSGKGWLDFNASVDTRAPQGKTGTLLLDPTSIWIANDLNSAYGGGMFGSDTSADGSGAPLFEASGPVSDSLLMTSTLTSALAANNVTVSTANTNPSAYGGYISVIDPISWSSSRSLTLLAHYDIDVRATSITGITNGGSGGISLYSGWNGANTTTPVVTPGFSSLSLNAPVSTLGNVALVSGGAIYQGINAPITANRLLAMADGGEGVNLNAATNMVNFLAGKTAGSSCCNAGSFYFQNGKSLTVDSVTIPNGTVNGVVITNGNNDTIDINVTSGVLTINRPVSATSNSTSANVNLYGTGGVVINSNVSAQTPDNPTGVSSQAYVYINSSTGSINVTGAGNLSATSGNSGTQSSTGYIFTQAGPAQVSLYAATGITHGGSISATAGQGGIVTTTGGDPYYAYAYGGGATVVLSGGTGGVGGVGSITAKGGKGGTTSGGYYGVSDGGYANVNIFGAGPISLSGSISAEGGAGGTATGTIVGTSGVTAYAYARGGSGSVQFFSDTSVAVSGAVTAKGGNGGSATATNGIDPLNVLRYADGGSGSIDIGTIGQVTIGTGGMTATGGNGGTGGASYGGSAGIGIADGAEGISGPAGAIQIGGNLIVTGGAGTNGGYGGSADVVVWGTDVNLPSGANITASGGNGTPKGIAEVNVVSQGDVTLGGNITTSGGVFVDQQTSDVFGGIYIQAGLGGGGAIIGNGGVLSAVRAAGSGEFPIIELTAVNGIGTVGEPVRVLDASEATGPDIRAFNSGVTGDIAISAVASDISLVGDLDGLLNNNPNGIYLIQTEAAGKDLLFDIPFLPSGAPLVAGQTVLLGALNADVIIGPSGSIATSGTGYTSLLAGGSISSTGSITGLVNANALGGAITISQAPGVTLGLMQATGNVSVDSKGGAIVDGNGGAMNVIAPSAGLFGAAGAGSLADPLETQIGILSGSATGTFGVVNAGDLAINGFTFSGSDAAIGTTGTLSLMTPISATTGNLYLAANNGMLIEQGVTVGGDLSLAAGAGDLGVSGVDVLATNITLSGNNIFIGFSTTPTMTGVIASNLVTGTSAGNFNVIGGSTSTAHALLEGQNVNLTVGTTSGYLNLVTGSAGAPAEISSISPTTITVNFPNLSSGGYFVDGVEGATLNGSTGFIAAGAPAVLNQNLIVTYGLAPPPPPATGGGDTTGGQVTDNLNTISDINSGPETLGDSSTGGGTPEEKEKKGLPVCK